MGLGPEESAGPFSDNEAKELSVFFFVGICYGICWVCMVYYLLESAD